MNEPIKTTAWGPRQRADRPWCEYPVGTRALALMGGQWTKTEHGWRWMERGGTFPTPGADAFDVQVPIEREAVTDDLEY